MRADDLTHKHLISNKRWRDIPAIVIAECAFRLVEFIHAFSRVLHGFQFPQLSDRICILSSHIHDNTVANQAHNTLRLVHKNNICQCRAWTDVSYDPQPSSMGERKHRRDEHDVVFF